MKKTKHLNIGNMVRWISQAGGFTRSKEGEIVAIVPEGHRPDRELFPDLYKGPGCGYGRRGDSFVVRVRRKHYWPLVSKLKSKR